MQHGPHPPGHQAGSAGWMVTLCPLYPSPCHLFKPPKVSSCPGNHLDRISNTDLSVWQEPGVKHPVPSSYQLCAKAFSIFPTLSPNRDKNTGSPETCSSWLVVTSTPGAFPCPPTIAASQVRSSPGTQQGCLGPVLRLLFSLHPGLSIDLKLQLAQKRTIKPATFA